MMLNFLKNKSVWIGLFIISYFVLVIPQIQKLFIADEIDFVKTAHGIATTGMPIYMGSGNNIQMGLWHPTLYSNLLAASFKIFGVHEWSARMVSVLFTLLTLLVIYLIMKHLAFSNFSKELAILIFLFNPLIVQGSLLIDIDNSILMFFIALFVYAYLKLDREKPKNLLLLGILFATALWAKIPTPPVLILSILIFHTLNREYKRGLLESLVIGVVGGIIFLATWILYCNLFDLPFLQPFMHNIGYVGVGTNEIHFLLTHLWGFKNILFWATPFFILLILVVSLNRAKIYHKNRKLEAIDFLIIVGLLIFLEYLIVGSHQAADFPRYFIPMMPLFSVVFAGYFERVKELTRKDLNAVVFVSMIIIAHSILVLKDPLLIDRIIFNTASIYKIAEETAVVTVLYFLPFVISYAIFRALKVKNAFMLSIILPLLICGVYIDAIQVKADYATCYFYGERGMIETIDYLSSHIDNSDAVIARKDVVYYLAVKEFYRLPENPEELERLIDSKDVEYIIINKYGYFTMLKYVEVFELIGSKCKLEKEFLDFKIYRVR
jgi:4-amino-4-deoxy-L-arabinose transferase-like glycosyltransferase